MAKSFQELLNQTATANTKFRRLLNECGERFIKRYGIHYSDLDADFVIDSLDYNGDSITVAECDETMTQCGHPPRRKKKS